MRVITRRRLKEFWLKHEDAEVPLLRWYRIAKSAEWKNFDDVKRTFSKADVYKQFTIFNIGGNKYRLIVAIHYNTSKIFVRYVLTHREYDKEEWKS